MSIWSGLLKIGGSAVRVGGRATKETVKVAGNTVLHPAQTLRGAGSAVKKAAVGGAVGYVGWEKLTTDKSVVRIVSDAVVGEETTDALGDTVQDVRELKDKAGEAVESVKGAVAGIDSKWNGMTNFFRGLFSGNAVDMFGNFFGNLGKGNVSGLSIAGLVAAAWMVFGRGGWLGKIAGTLLAMMMIGNNSNVSQLVGGGSAPQRAVEEESVGKGMRR